VALLSAALVSIGALIWLLQEPSPRDGAGTSSRATSRETADRARQAAVAAAAPKETREESPGSAESRPGAFAKIEGRCVDGVRSPIARATLEIDGRPIATSDGDGVWKGTVPVDRRSLARVVVRAAGYCNRTVDATLSPGEATDLGEVFLERAYALAGRVVDPSGNAVVGAEVVLRRVTAWTGAEIVWKRNGPDEGTGGRIARTQSGAEGRFAFDAAPPAVLEVWARPPKSFFTRGDPVDWAREDLRREVVVVARISPAEDRIEGRVVAEGGGAPPPHTEVEATEMDGGIAGRRESLPVTPDGTFVVLLERRAPQDLIAVADEEHGESDVSRGVLPGTRGVVLELRRGKELALVLRSAADDSPVRGWVQVQLDVTRDRNVTTTFSVLADSEGRATMRMPRQEFRLGFLAPGFRPSQLGTFEPDALPQPLALKLVPLASVRGVVTADGRPVEGARVELLRAVDDDAIADVHGFRARSGRTDRFATTASDGSFAIPIEGERRVFVRAAKSGRAAGDAGPFEFDDRGVEGIEIRLGRGGAIEGRVLVPEDASPAGIVVGISRGDGFPDTRRVHEDGLFRFDRLTPGSYELREVEREIDPADSSWSSAKRESTAGELRVDPEYPCEVHEGETTRFDLDLRPGGSATSCRLDCTLSIAGRSTSGLLAILDDGSSNGIGETIDGTGRFTFRRSAPCRCRLRIHDDRFDRARPGATLEIEAPVELVRGIRTWSLALDVGAIAGAVKGWSAGSVPRASFIQYSWTGAGGMTAELSLFPGPDGSLAAPIAPAGRGMLRWNVDGVERSREITVPAGGTATVEIP